MAPPGFSLPDLQRLHDDLVAQADRDVELALKVAVLLELDRPQHEIARVLSVPLGDVKRAVRRLRQIAPRIEREDPSW